MGSTEESLLNHIDFKLDRVLQILDNEINVHPTAYFNVYTGLDGHRYIGMQLRGPFGEVVARNVWRAVYRDGANAVIDKPST